MYCHSCGKKLPEGGMFCPFCGASAWAAVTAEAGEVSAETAPSGEEPSVEASPPESTSPARETLPQAEPSAEHKKGLACPHCGSHNTQYVAKSVTTTQGHNYSCLGGVCGSVLMGPVGLLLGLCGGNKRTVTTDTSCWVCGDCGKEFLAPDKIAQQCKSSARGVLVFSGIFLVVGILMGGLNDPIGAYSTLGMGGFITAFIGGIMLYGAFKIAENSGYSPDDLIPGYQSWKQKQILIALSIVAAEFLLALLFLASAV